MTIVQLSKPQDFCKSKNPKIIKFHIYDLFVMKTMKMVALWILITK